jgi:predicted nucleic acid-binding protein
MTELVFVDSNVFVYARDGGEPTKQPRAAAWLDRLWRERSGRTSMQVLSEYYVNLTRKLSPGLSSEEAWDDVSALLAWQPIAIDEPVMRRGREIEQRYRLSWWDSLIVAAAQLQGCAVLLTEDLQDAGVYGGVTVRSPFTLAASEPDPASVVMPAGPANKRRGGRAARSAS